MKDVISVNNMRESDAYTIKNSIPSLTLMYNAALGVFNNVSWKGNIALVCGKGNNAGDAYALSIILKDHNIDSTLVLIEDKFSQDGKYYFDKAKEKGIKHIYVKDTDFSEFDIIVDGILGTGFKGSLSQELKEVINKINNAHKYVVSIDINSGLNGDSGMCEDAIKSDVTISIGNYKFGHFLNMAMDYAKEVINVDISIPALYEEGKLLEIEDIKCVFKERKHFSNKGVYGYVGIIGGSSRYIGAVRLANMGQSALYAGAGVSKVIVPNSISQIIYQNVIESTVVPLSVDSDGNMIFKEDEIKDAVKGLKAIALGIGWGVNKENQKILKYLLENLDGIPLVIDADGINNLVELGVDNLLKTKAKIILTPHLKEFSRLSGNSVLKIEENSVVFAKEFANKYGVTLLLKGPTTIVCDKEKMYLVNRGTPGMAVAGSGDVLTGILVGILGHNQDDIAYSIACGAYINGLAGEIASKEYGDISMVSSDTARCISKAIKKFL